MLRRSIENQGFCRRHYLDKNVMARLGVIERKTAVEPCHDTAPERFDYLIRTLHDQTGQRVVVLVDEYDKPILDALRDEDVARANRDYLRGLYSVIKDCDSHIGFCFLTGVSKFSKVSLFSGLNNLRDITLSPTYSAICGYTEDDLDTVFAAELPGLDRQKIRDWYNGYGWGGPERVYNPFDVLPLLADRVFKPWWFDTGTPTFLIETLVDRHVAAAALDGRLASENLLSTFDVGRISIEALLFQSGYLTVVGNEWHDGMQYYRLGYPNREVRQSLNLALLDHFTGDQSLREENSRTLGSMLRKGDLEELKSTVKTLFSTIPSDWHRRNQLDRYEGYYASVFYAYFAGLQVEITLEDSSSRGRLDMAVQAGGRVYLFEFKVQERAAPGAALEQLKARGYADKYRHLGVPVHLVGVEFSVKTRNVEGFEYDLA